ncbi:MAG: zf-TFIIB domain-containing protein [Sedimentisphaerales bacterium]|jgi:Zn-finger nucleic acid-binding protein
MNCPVCKNPMIILELDRVETDFCTECGGIWLDAGELELLFADANQARHLVNSFHQESGVKEKQRPCPICLKKMQKIHTGGKNEQVLIDRCPKGHGLWFDRGELAQVLAKGNFDKERKVIKHLSELFSHKENQGER